MKINFINEEKQIIETWYDPLHVPRRGEWIALTEANYEVDNVIWFGRIIQIELKNLHIDKFLGIDI